jgi:hypothetical protein
MKTSCSLLVVGVSILMGLVQVLAADAEKLPLSTVKSHPTLDSKSKFDGIWYKSEIDWGKAIRRTSGVDPATGKHRPGIGLVAASELGVASIAKLIPHWKEEWLLDGAKRKLMGGDSYIYEITFVKLSAKDPGSLPGRLNIWVLFDGTVVPFRTSKKSWLRPKKYGA